MKTIRNIFYLCLFIWPAWLGAQETTPDAASIFHKMQRLEVLGTALYLAAHPDDENQRVISWLVNERGLHTSYLSLTRGDGGQNLIGPEIREMLGVIRTQELLAARSIDGGHQRFTRAVDFGYSKHPDETFSIWNKEAVLGDLVYAIRELKPDVIIHRFDHRTAGTTHGHHTGSAVLGMEAFDLAGDPAAFPEQLEQVEHWQPQRSFFNTSWWFYGSREKFSEADKTNLYEIPIGTYYPLLGLSNNEIAYAARSMHRCQGFGSTLSRGEQTEWLEYLAGTIPSSKEDPLSGLDLSWSRVTGGEAIGIQVKKLLSNYNFNKPSDSVGDLLAIHESIGQLEDDHWRRRKQAEVEELLVDILGLYAELRTDDHSYNPGETAALDLELTLRQDVPVRLRSIEIMGQDTSLDFGLQPNAENIHKLMLTLPADQDYTGAFWLESPGTLGLYSVDDMSLRTQPRKKSPLSARIGLLIDGKEIFINREAVYRWRDPAYGQRYRKVEILPRVSASFDQSVYILNSDSSQTVELKIEAHGEQVEGELELDLPSGWTCDPRRQAFSLTGQGETQRIAFQLIPPAEAAEGLAAIQIYVGDERYTQDVLRAEYDHIGIETALMPAQSRIVRLDIQTEGDRIAYIMGAGDRVPEALRAIGYTVDVLDMEDVTAAGLSSYDATIVGVRAFNTLDALKYKNRELFKYAEQGGTVIVQYNTAHRLKTEELAPYPIELSRLRVTDETATVQILAPEHPVLHYPNALTEVDWDGWVQERGLYFPKHWDDRYIAPIAMADPEMEEAVDGSLLIAAYGQGYYVYTGLSLFRELPAGVPGAYRLLANLIAL